MNKQKLQLAGEEIYEKLAALNQHLSACFNDEPRNTRETFPSNTKIVSPLESTPKISMAVDAMKLMGKYDITAKDICQYLDFYPDIPMPRKINNTFKWMTRQALKSTCPWIKDGKNFSLKD